MLNISFEPFCNINLKNRNGNKYANYFDKTQEQVSITYWDKMHLHFHVRIDWQQDWRRNPQVYRPGQFLHFQRLLRNIGNSFGNMLS